MNIQSGFTTGKLTAIEPINGGKFWLCKCLCGNNTKASKWHLLRNKRASCGCRTKIIKNTCICKKCNEEKPIGEFYVRKQGRMSSYTCKSCIMKRITERSRQARIKVVDHYGGKCACCGETHKEFLAIDHINGGGNKHRKENKIHSLHKWLIRHNYPSGFRILCNNCNFSLGAFGYCPHQKRDS